MTTSPNLDRIAQGIRERRADTGAETGKSSAVDALRDLVRAGSDPTANLARLTQRNAQTPTTTEKDA